MTLEPAQRGGDVPHAVRLPVPARDADPPAEHDQWLGRRSLQRQLHDGAALRISALTLRLGFVRHRMSATDPELLSCIDGMQDQLHAVLQELRDVTRKIYPPLLDEAGLGPALQEVACRIPVTVRVEAPDVRFGPAVEGSAYFAVTECLDALDDSAAPVVVLVRTDAGALAVHVTGVDVCHARLMHDQVRRMGGTIDVVGGPGVGTIIARIPCA